MNYLSHFVFNHVVRGLSPEPHFSMGVVLPDLWLRFSRRRRIRWTAVRAAAPSDAVDAGLRAGLLNHADVDRRFHALPTFLYWHGELRRGTEPDGTHPALVDFLVHMGIELALDHRLLIEDPALVERFYKVAGGCDPRSVSERVGALAAVDTTGLEDVIERFVRRRFLRRYTSRAGLGEVVRIVLSLARIPIPGNGLIDGLIERAVRTVEPAAVWAELVQQ